MTKARKAKEHEYKKVRFRSTRYGSTSGLVFTVKELRELGLQGVSRSWPMSEAVKMERIQLSPPFNSYIEAFNYDFEN